MRCLRPAFLPWGFHFQTKKPTGTFLQHGMSWFAARTRAEGKERNPPGKASAAQAPGPSGHVSALLEWPWNRTCPRQGHGQPSALHPPTRRVCLIGRLQTTRQVPLSDGRRANVLRQRLRHQNRVFLPLRVRRLSLPRVTPDANSLPKAKVAANASPRSAAGGPPPTFSLPTAPRRHVPRTPSALLPRSLPPSPAQASLTLGLPRSQVAWSPGPPTPAWPLRATTHVATKTGLETAQQRGT